MSISVGEAKQLVPGLLDGTGLERGRSDVTAQALLLAEVWGVTSHGLMRVPSFLTRLDAGGFDAGADLTTVVADPFSADLAATPQRVAHLVLTLDPALWSGDGGVAATRRLDELAARTAAAGGLVPGATRRLSAEINDADDLPVSDATLAQLRQVAAQRQVPRPAPDP